MDVQSIIEKIKGLVRKGNVTRIIVKRNNQQILNIPVNVGAVGAVVGLAYAKWILLAGVLATIGFGCTVEVLKSDGDVVNVLDEERNQKVRDFASEAVDRVKDNIPVSINVDIKRDNSSTDTNQTFDDTSK